MGREIRNKTERDKTGPSYPSVVAAELLHQWVYYGLQELSLSPPAEVVIQELVAGVEGLCLIVVSWVLLVVLGGQLHVQGVQEGVLRGLAVAGRHLTSLVQVGQD